MIEAGAGDETWRMPWHAKAGQALMTPRNPISGTRYRGINVPILWAAAEDKGYRSGLWATYKQWAEKGAQVRKGEKSELIFFWKKLTVPSARGDGGEGEDDGADAGGRRLRFMARAYCVFAAEQVEGYAIPPVLEPDSLAEAARIADAEAFFKRLGAELRHGGDRAFYAPAVDAIQMPEFEQFHDAAGYYSTLGHEHIHWTGAKSRCAREFGRRFGDEAYAFEELVAELGAAFLCAELGIANEPRRDHARYLGSWLRVLESDARAVFTAGGKAQAAVDWLLKAAAAA
jgi:antirestriction protein ArdC